MKNRFQSLNYGSFSFPEGPPIVEMARLRRPGSISWETHTINDTGHLVQISKGNCFSDKTLRELRSQTTSPRLFVTLSGHMATGGAEVMVQSPTLRNNAIKELTLFVVSNNFRGAQVDFEPMSYFTPKIHEGFMAFVRELKAALGANKKELHLIVSAIQDSTYQKHFSWTYRELAKHCDKVIPMLYGNEWDSENSPSGPQAPRKWRRSVLIYLRSELGAELFNQKAGIALATDGYLTVGKKTTRFPSLQAGKGELQFLRPTRDAESGALLYDDKGRRGSWEDQDSITEMALEAQRLGMRKEDTYLWYMSPENPWPKT